MATVRYGIAANWRGDEFYLSALERDVYYGLGESTFWSVITATYQTLSLRREDYGTTTWQGEFIYGSDNALKGGTAKEISYVVNTRRFNGIVDIGLYKTIGDLKYSVQSLLKLPESEREAALLSGADVILGSQTKPEVAQGFAGDDIIKGFGGWDKLFGDDGADTIYGGNNQDTIRGGDGSDRLFGDNGTSDTAFDARDDILGGAGSDLIYGNGGNDKIHGDGFEATSDTDGADSIFGGGGQDKIYGCGGNDVIRGDDGSDWLSGGTGNDQLLGGAGDDVIYGNGNENDSNSESDLDRKFDILFGQQGDDILYGGLGPAKLVGGAGADKLIGSSFNSTASYEDATAPVAVFLATPRKNTGEAKGDSYTFVQNATGSKFDDKIYGNDEGNTISGLAGRDILSGGRGADTFVFNTSFVATTNYDDILDFDANEDRILLDLQFFGAVNKKGALLSEMFKDIGVVNSIVDADDRVFFDRKTGDLFYDGDGSQINLDPVKFARITNKTILDASHIFLT